MVRKPSIKVNGKRRSLSFALVAVVLCFLLGGLATLVLDDGGLSVKATALRQGSGSPLASEDAFEEAQVTRVVDGDTVIVDRGAGKTERVRLIGINAPESVAEDESRNCEEGRVASAYLKSLVAPGTKVWLTRDVSDTDTYGRLLRYVWLERPDDPRSTQEVAEKMLNGKLVAEGYAEAHRYKPDTSYAGILETLGRQATSRDKGVSYYWS